MKNRRVIIYIVAMIVGFIFIYWFGRMNQKKMEDISENGIETIGTVINRTITRNPKQFESYMIKFDFEYNGKKVQGHNRFTKRWYYENAIIGMKYEVKYLTDAPNKNSVIYINKPINSEYINVEKERNRILNAYKDAKVSLKKNARPLEELQSLKP